jgi:hypothetical protein
MQLDEKFLKSASLREVLLCELFVRTLWNESQPSADEPHSLLYAGDPQADEPEAGFCFHSYLRFPNRWRLIQDQPIESKLPRCVTELAEIHRFANIAVGTQTITGNAILFFV